MRRIIVWALVILLVIGFVYTGNNLLKANGFSESEVFPMQFVPKSDLCVIETGNSHYTQALFPSISVSYPSDINSAQTIYLLQKEDSVSYITKPESTDVELKDLLLADFKENSFDTTLEWESGFPLIEASNLNKRFFASCWRNWAFLGTDRQAIERIFATILQKTEPIKNDTDFQQLWKNSNAPLYGIVYKNGESVFTEKLKIPFVNFSYPIFFEFDKNILTLSGLTGAPTGTLFFNPFDFDGAPLEIAEPELGQIKNFINESGLQIIISEKLGFPFNKFSAFSSMNSGEFVLLSKNEFAFVLKSTPISNSIYETELQNLLPLAKTSKENINNFALITFENVNTKFYTLEMPSLFAISNNKDVLEKIANKQAGRVNAGNSSVFLSVNSRFNDIANLYSLNVTPLTLPDFATSCVLTQKKRDEKLITEITFGK